MKNTNWVYNKYTDNLLNLDLFYSFGVRSKVWDNGKTSWVVYGRTLYDNDWPIAGLMQEEEARGYLNELAQRAGMPPFPLMDSLYKEYKQKGIKCCSVDPNG